MRYVAIGISDQGRVRRNNEDNLYLQGVYREARAEQRFYHAAESERLPALFAISDGMGGEALGEEASYMAVVGLDRVEAELRRGADFSKLMPRYLKQVNTSLCQLGQRGRRMGATFAALLLREDEAQSINIGDSRVYLLREGRLFQLSKDHTAAQKLVELGILDAAEASKNPERHKLTQHLGLRPEEGNLKAALSAPLRCRPGDLFLLCTDGLTEMLETQEILEILSRDSSLKLRAEELLRQAMGRGAKDNTSFVLVELQGWQTEESGPYQDFSLEGVQPQQLVVQARQVQQPPVAERPMTTELPRFSAEDQRRFEAARQAALQRQSAQVVQRSAQNRILISDYVSANPEAQAAESKRLQERQRRRRGRSRGQNLSSESSGTGAALGASAFQTSAPSAVAGTETESQRKDRGGGLRIVLSFILQYALFTGLSYGFFALLSRL